MDVAKGIRDFLSSRRARIKPEDVGLPPGGRRRVPGLRREEVAQLASVTTEYYVQIVPSPRQNARHRSDSAHHQHPKEGRQ